MTEVEMPPSLVPERRRRPSPEIIDVDLLNDDDIRPFQRRRLSSSATNMLQPILILDSDDEEAHAGNRASSSGSRRVQESSPRRQQLFSPPPPPQDDIVPPVPVLPARFASQSSLPMRRRPPPFPASGSGVVHPIEQPFPFEASFRQVEHRNQNPPPPAAAPPSHHQPAMGLGGALIAMNRQNAADERNIRVRARDLIRSRRTFTLPTMHEATGYLANALRRISGGGSRHRDPPYMHYADPMLALMADEEVPVEAIYPMLDYDDRRIFRRFEPDYKPAFTHFGKPIPGFTFDFAPSPSSPPSPAASGSNSAIVIDDTPGPSNASTSASASEEESTVLVCARCLDPLVLGGVESEEERVRRRLWGLRCGHLLDGKCVEEIMKAKSASIAVQNAVDHLDKEKTIEADPLVVADTEIRRDKGKGKAVDLEPLQLPPFPDSIRSRLRPRHSQPDSHPPHAASQSHAGSSSRPTRPLPTRRGPTTRPKAKGKGKAREPVVEAEHEWNCPVAGCRRAHVSLCLDGKWIMDERRGAIAVFV